MDVFTRDDVPTQAVHEPLDGVEGNHVAGMCRGEVVGLPEDFPALPREYLPFAGCSQGCRAHTTFVFDDAADGCLLRTREVKWGAEFEEERVQFLFSEVRVRKAQSFDFVHDTPVVPSLPFLLGSA